MKSIICCGILLYNHVMMTDKTNDLKKTYTDKLWDNEEDWAAAKDIDDSEADDWDLPEIGDEIDPDEEGQDINFYGKEPEKHAEMPENEDHPEHIRTQEEQEKNPRPTTQDVKKHVRLASLNDPGSQRPASSGHTAGARPASENDPDSRRHAEQAAEEESRPLSAFAYFGYALLFCVPVAGVLLLLIIALRTKNRNLRSYAFGFLLFMAAVLAVLCCAVMLGAFDGVLGRA